MDAAGTDTGASDADGALQRRRLRNRDAQRRFRRKRLNYTGPENLNLVSTGSGNRTNDFPLSGVTEKRSLAKAARQESNNSPSLHNNHAVPEEARPPYSPILLGNLPGNFPSRPTSHQSDPESLDLAAFASGIGLESACVGWEACAAAAHAWEPLLVDDLSGASTAQMPTSGPQFTNHPQAPASPARKSPAGELVDDAGPWMTPLHKLEYGLAHQPLRAHHVSTSP